VNYPTIYHIELAYLQLSRCSDNPFFNRSGVREKVPADCRNRKNLIEYS